MKPMICTLTLLLLTVCVTGQADDAGAKSTMEAAYAKFSKACLRRDLPSVMATFTPDAVFKTPDGKVQTYPEIKQAMRNFLKNLGPGSRLSFDVKIVDRKSANKIVAVVEEKLHQVPLKSERISSHRKPEGNDETAQWRDTWVKTKKGWQNCIGVTLTTK